MSAVGSSGTSRTTPPESSTDLGAAKNVLALRWVHPVGQHTDVLLDRDVVTLGRGTENDLVLLGSAISRRHAVIERRGRALGLIDQDSRNGVFSNGERVTTAPLGAGSVLRIGDYVGVIFERGPDPALPCSELAPGLVGSAALGRSIDLARKVAPSTLAILICGETGTGKELLARSIHALSGREGPLVAVNSAALNDSLLDAELFGHEKGAFTGADRARTGWIRDADGGTLFLDEVAELSPAAQAKLLRVVETQEVMPVGSTRSIRIALRVVSATHSDLETLVRERRFREDLLARLKGARIELPPLRERREDIPALFGRFASHVLGRPCPPLSPRAVEKLCLHRWPRNIRELRQLAELVAVRYAEEPRWRRRHLTDLAERSSPSRSVAISTHPSDSATRGGLPSGTLPDGREQSHRPRPASPRPRELDRRALLDALDTEGGNVTRAAERLRISKQSFYTRAAELAIDLEALRRQPRGSD